MIIPEMEEILWVFYVAGYRGIWITEVLDTAYVDRDENDMGWS